MGELDDDTLADIGTDQTLAHTPDLASDSGVTGVQIDARAPSDASPRYVDHGLLGRGGMGEVRLTHDAHIGRVVALKAIRGASGGAVTERFLREARVQAQLEHPAVVPVYDLGVAPDGRVYFTMKRVRGRSLESLIATLREGHGEDASAPVTRRQLLGALSQICLAVEYAHARGVLHRDLKPANIMLGDFGDIHVLDWGLAKVRGVADLPPEAEAEDTLEVASQQGSETVAGSMLGTPGYMAPEQAHGNLDAVDVRSDVYALGAILFEILYLEPLHAGQTVMARLASTVAGPASFASRARHDDVPPELVSIIEKATALDPRDRHGSARELSLAIERYLDGERDEARRRELAEEHVARARALAGGSADDRLGALRELGRAIALDPSHEAALTLLESMLVLGTSDVPEEARSELEEMRREHRGEHARVHFVRATSWIAFAPLVIAFGVTSLARATVLVSALALGWLTALLVRRKRSLDGALGVALFATAALGIGLMSFVLGPFIVVPTLAATSGVLGAMMVARRHRPILMGAFLLAVLVPFGLSVAGIEHAYYSFPDAATLVVTSPMVEYPPVLVGLFLTVVSVLAVVTPMTLVGRMNDRLAAAEERVFLQAWHLRQLLPKSDRSPSVVRPG